MTGNRLAQMLARGFMVLGLGVGVLAVCFWVFHIRIEIPMWMWRVTVLKVGLGAGLGLLAFGAVLLRRLRRSEQRQAPDTMPQHLPNEPLGGQLGAPHWSRATRARETAPAKKTNSLKRTP